MNVCISEVYSLSDMCVVCIAGDMCAKCDVCAFVPLCICVCVYV